MTIKSQIKTDCRFIQKWVRKGVADAHNNGYSWYKNKFLLAINRIEENSEAQKYFELLSEAYYLAGEINSFNSAHRSAIKAYKKSVYFDADWSAAWRELGGEYDCVGNVSQAIKCLKKAVSIDPEDEYARADLDCVEFQKGKKEYAVNDKTLFEWDAWDLLAEGKHKKLLDMFKGKRSLNAFKFSAAAKGLLGDIDGCKEEWHKLVKVKSKINFTYGDWFYMPDEVFDSPSLWEAIWAIREKISIKNNIFIAHDSLTEILKDKIKNSDSRIKKERSLIIKFNIARTKLDLNHLKRLFSRYPQWKEVKDCKEKLEKFSN